MRIKYIFVPGNTTYPSVVVIKFVAFACINDEFNVVMVDVKLPLGLMREGFTTPSNHGNGSLGATIFIFIFHFLIKFLTLPC